METKIPAEKAKQGRKGNHVLIILLAALMLALAAWGVAEFYGEAIDNGSKQSEGGVTP